MVTLKNPTAKQICPAPKLLIETRPWIWLFLLLLPAASVLINGYGYGIGDSRLYIPLIEKRLDPSLFPTDYLFSEPSQHYNLWIPLITFLCRFFPTESVFLAGYLSSLFLFFVAGYHLSLNIFRDRQTALLSALLLIPWQPVAGTTLHTNEIMFTLRTTAGPFLITFLIAYWKKKLILSAFLLGITFILHPLAGIMGLGCFLFSLAAHIIRRHYQAPTIAVSIFIIILLPLLVGILKVEHATTNLSIFSSQSPLWHEVIQFRLGYYFLSSWRTADWLNLVSVFIFLSLILYYRHRLSEQPDQDRPAREITGVVVMTYILGFLMTEVARSPFFIQIQLFRCFYLLSILGVIYLAWFLKRAYEDNLDYCLRLLRENSGASDCSPQACAFAVLSSLGAILFFILFFLKKNPYESLSFLLLFWLFFQQHKLSSFFRYPAVIISICLFIVQINSTFIPFSKALWLAGMTAAAFALSQLWFFVRTVKRKRPPAADPRLSGQVFFLCSFIMITMAVIWAIHDFHRIFDKSLLGSVRQESEWMDVQEWALKNSPVDAVFLVPPDVGGFRVFSKRSIVGEVKDGAPAAFSESYAMQWAERMNDTHRFYLSESYNIFDLIDKYRITHIVTANDNDILLPFNRVYENARYAVYCR